MEIERYLEIRRSFTKFVDIIVQTDEDRKVNMKRAATKLGLLDEGVIVIMEELDSNALMDYMLFEKNGRADRLIDRFLLHSKGNLDKNESNLLDGLLKNHFSFFELKAINKENFTLSLFDIIEKKDLSLVDIGFSQTAIEGIFFAARIIPIEGINITSGLTFAFEEKNRLRLLTEISKHARKKNRKRSIKIKANKTSSPKLIEIMIRAHKKWGVETITYLH